MNVSGVMFFSLEPKKQRSKEAKNNNNNNNNNNNAWSQVSVSLDTESLLKAIQGFAEVPMSAYGLHIKGHGRNEKLIFIGFTT